MQSSSDISIWEKERDRIKTLWVFAVAFFWFSASFQLVLYLLDGQTNLVLISVITGMLVLGVWLKIRLQLHLRRKPPTDSDTAAVNPPTQQ